MRKIPLSAAVITFFAAGLVHAQAFNLSLLNIADNSPAGQQLTFSNATAGATANGGWILADQYILLNVIPDNPTWGVQIYTDNMASDANPKFVSPVQSGLPGSNPAGLVLVGDPTETLSIGWHIQGDSHSLKWETRTMSSAGSTWMMPIRHGFPSPALSLLPLACFMRPLKTTPVFTGGQPMRNSAPPVLRLPSLFSSKPISARLW